MAMVVSSGHGSEARGGSHGTDHCTQPSQPSFYKRRNPNERFMTSAQQSWNEYWLPSDLFFLRDALERGMTLAEASGFLSRNVDEVRRKAKQMKIPYRRLPHYGHYRLRRGR